jgi:hypothetical protein
MWPKFSSHTKCHLLLFLCFIISILSGCSKADIGINYENSVPGFLLKSLYPSINKIKADRINLILVGKGYKDINSFLATAKRDLAIDGKEIIDPNSFDKVLLGLFAIEPFKGNISKFNIWYYPDQITSDAVTFLQSQRNKSNPAENDFGLKNASYIIFTNPDAEVNSFAFPSNILPKQPIIKEKIIFGSTNVARYPTIADGMSVVAHELGHSLFNLRDEYVRTGPIFTDKYGFNIAPSLSEAKLLWGNVENQIDPFYYTWREKRKSAGYWIDKTQPFLIGEDKTTKKSIYTWQPSEEDMRVGYFEGGGVTTTGISWRPTMTSIMSNEDVRDKSWPQFPPVFGSANRKVMEDVLKYFSGQ